jgi:hypothetical protein
MRNFYKQGLKMKNITRHLPRHRRNGSMIKRFVLFLLLFSCAMLMPAAAAPLEADFAAPPPDTRPGCYWYFLKDDVTKAGITADLEAMARTGIGRAFIGYINQGANPPGDNSVLSEKWWERLEHTFLEADRLGVDIGLFNCPGWSQSGGPWIPPERSMRSLVHTEVQATGPKVFDDILPGREGYFETVKVMAFPMPPQEAVTMSGAGCRISSPSADSKPDLFRGGSAGFRSALRRPGDPGNPAGGIRKLRVTDASGKVLLDEDFSGGLENWAKPGQSRIEDGVLRPILTDNPPMHRKGLRLPQKFTLETEVKLAGEGRLGIALGVRDAANYCFWQLTPGRLNPHFRIDGKYHIQRYAAEAIPAEKWFGLRITSDGETVSTFVDGKLINETGARPDSGRGALDALFDGDPETAFTFPEVPSKRSAFIIDFESDTPWTVQSIIADPLIANAGVSAELLTSDDGKAYTTAAEVELFHGKQGVRILDPIAAAVAPVTAKHFRFKITRTRGQVTWKSLELSPRAMLDKYAIKQLGDIHPEPHPYYGVYEWETQPEPALADSVIQTDTCIDLTDRVSDAGHLKWEVPEGKWIIARFAMVSTGSENGPAMPDATGLEVDKMSAAHVRFHFDHYAGSVLERIPPENRKRFRYIIQDSYETGPQNWTDGLIGIFRERYGYDPVPWLPVMTGRITGSAALSERFLWDLRRLVADRVASEYVGGLTEAAEAHGLIGWLENYGHWGFPGEALLYGKYSTEVGGEFWLNSSLGAIELRPASSCANIYGKKEVYAEAFTSGIRYIQTPRSHFKHYGDWAFSHGINHFILHVYIHQPRDNEAPGVDAWFGTNFNRHNTWFNLSKGFIDYTRRMNYMLKQGVHVADVCYFTGEGAPKMDGPWTPPLPRGYDFDYINGDALLNRMTVEDGWLRVKDGPAYRVLVLPPVTTMRPEIAARLEHFVEGGAIVCGPRPLHAPSLENYPACDGELNRIAEKLWGTGKIRETEDLTPLLNAANIAPDFDYRLADGDRAEKESGLMDMGHISRPQKNALRFIHRQEDDRDIYFVANVQDEALDAQCTFRVKDKQPEIWDAVTGRIEKAAAFTLGEDRVSLPLHFAPRQSFLIVFREAAAQDGGAKSNRRERQRLATLDGPWEVQFDTAMGGPEQVSFPELIPWNRHADEGIRYYSGEAVYRKTFSLDGTPERRVWLHLGEVADLAHVKINGEDAGYVWTAPWEADVTGLLIEGENTLEIRAANTWNNRILGDEKTGTKHARFYTPYKPEKLLPAGLIGPVTLETTQQP